MSERVTLREAGAAVRVHGGVAGAGVTVALAPIEKIQDGLDSMALAKWKWYEIESPVMNCRCFGLGELDCVTGPPGF